MQVRVANMLADSGKAWSELVAQHNSGTCNNQYVVVDLKLFQPNKVPQAVNIHTSPLNNDHFPLHFATHFPYHMHCADHGFCRLTFCSILWEHRIHYLSLHRVEIFHET